MKRILLVMILVLAIFAWDKYSNNQNDSLPESTWGMIIEKSGPAEAYQQFKDSVSASSIEEQHTKAHDFGQALYEELGIEGVTTCGSDFGFGCYHQFFLSAIADRGLDVVSELDDACIKKFGLGGQGCQHGIGHGLIELLSHSVSGALEICVKMKWQERLFGCSSGVFMEYNFPSFITDQGSKRPSRSYDPLKPYEPCLTVMEKYKEGCIYAQAEWWDKGTNQDYTSLGKLCSQLRDQKLNKICFIGLGNSAVSANGFDEQKTLTACSGINQEAGKLLCRSGAYWGFWDSGNKSSAVKMCLDENKSVEAKCLKEADLLNENIASINEI